MKEIIDSSSLSPINVTWELTLACNLRCKHCGSAAGKCRSNELSLDRSLKLCDELNEIGTKEVTLIGGEPLISDKWFPIAKKLNNFGIKINFVSNGTIMSDEIIQKLHNEEFKKSFIEQIPTELKNYLSYQNSSSAKILELIDNDS